MLQHRRVQGSPWSPMRCEPFTCCRLRRRTGRGALRSRGRRMRPAPQARPLPRPQLPARRAAIASRRGAGLRRCCGARWRARWHGSRCSAEADCVGARNAQWCSASRCQTHQQEIQSRVDANARDTVLASWRDRERPGFFEVARGGDCRSIERSVCWDI